MDKSPYIADDEVFLRMSLSERIQHLILIIAFSILIITGLPLFFSEFKFFHWLIPSGRIFHIRGLIHRAAAVLMIGNFIWHLLYIAFDPRGRENFREMRPRLRDFKDAFEQFMFNLGLTRFLYRCGVGRKFFDRQPYWLFKHPPLYGRYNFIQKFEYWAAGLGSLIMILTGFFMWHVELSLRLFPLWVHNIFIIVHSYEAILALLTILTWHMYHVHLNPRHFPMSRLWLNGQITGKELRLFHPLEYQRIAAQRRLEAETKQKKSN